MVLAGVFDMGLNDRGLFRPIPARTIVISTADDSNSSIQTLKKVGIGLPLREEYARRPRKVSPESIPIWMCQYANVRSIFRTVFYIRKHHLTASFDRFNGMPLDTLMQLLNAWTQICEVYPSASL
jgi:hypothetical protein